MKKRNIIPILLIASIIMVFLIRTILALHIDVPHILDLFDILTFVGSAIILIKAHTKLKLTDWLLAVSLGCMVGIGMCFSTLFSPYPFFGVIQSNSEQAWLRGVLTFLSALGGLVIMRQGGPVQFHAANGDWRHFLRSILIGLAIGIPFSILNVFALRFTQGQTISWQNPSAALLDAIQPGIVEEVVYRFALWGLIWMFIKKYQPKRAIWLAGLLAMFIHNYSHFEDLFIQAPLVALGMGAVLALIWGLPELILARRNGLEAAIAFHWIQDAVRFLTGF